ncbi:MAG: universal stress protein [Arenicellales bacterium]
MKARNILVPVDGSDHSFDALQIAVLVAEKNGGRVTMLHVVPGGPLPEALKEYAYAEHMEPSPWLYEDQVAERILEAAAARVDGTTVNITRRIEKGDPATKILESAESLGCDLIVMGHRGIGDVESLLMGSVSHKVNHKAACGVITVKD